MDLKTHYMGLALKNPLVASASPLTADVGNIRRLEDAGVAAVILPSLFEEQIDAEARHYDRLLTATSDFNPEAATYFPSVDDYRVGPESYLRLIEDAKGAVDIPVIASLNGETGQGWVSYAKLMEQAGANGLEINVYFVPTDLSLTGRDIEQRYLDILKEVRAAVKIPIAVKLSPYFSAFGNMAVELDRAGADALVLFNRFYQPDIDLEKLDFLRDLNLSDPTEIRLPLLWTAVLSGQINASLGAGTGVRSSDEMVKYLLAGADAVMTTSALLRFGTGHAKTILEGLTDWLSKKGYASVSEMRGLISRNRATNPKVLERANYIKILQSYEMEEQS